MCEWKLPKKSETCFKKNREPLSEYDTLLAAQKSADYEYNRTPELHLIPYQCSKCGKYHLKPEEYYVRKIPSTCGCDDSDGFIKDSYLTKEDAKKMARIRAKAGVVLYPYPCPYGNGWHLTSHPYI